MFNKIVAELYQDLIHTHMELERACPLASFPSVVDDSDDDSDSIDRNTTFKRARSGAVRAPRKNKSVDEHGIINRNESGFKRLSAPSRGKYSVSVN